MSTSYRHSITNLHRGVHCDMGSARTRLRSVIELLERGLDTDTVADLRAVEQRLAEVADR
ncbi:hypothetical protein [Mycolicibacterium fortuitum]|uniref:hypothetical protein n=1 Tax=Mycolicibacterium fortuitum TaxID=1766 RepID=UPI0014905B66|nr:hypothetical protein [Mycolicibacterium fortuitum]